MSTCTSSSVGEPYIPIFWGPDVRGGRKLQTHTRDNYRNPRCAHAGRGLTIVTILATLILESVIIPQQLTVRLLFCLVKVCEVALILHPSPVGVKPSQHIVHPKTRGVSIEEDIKYCWEKIQITGITVSCKVCQDTFKRETVLHYSVFLSGFGPRGGQNVNM